MDTLKNFFPLSFKRNDTVANFIIALIIYVVIGIIAGALIALAGLITGWIPVVGAVAGWVLMVLGAIVDVYVVVGIVLQILAFTKVLK